MLFISVHVFIVTSTLAGFLFDLNQSNICRDIQKIERLVRQCIPIPQKIYSITKRLKTPEENLKKFQAFMSFIRGYRTTDTKACQ